MTTKMLHLYLITKRSSFRRRFDKVDRPWPFRSLPSSTVGRPLSCCGLLRCRLILGLTCLSRLMELKNADLNRRVERMQVNCDCPTALEYQEHWSTRIYR